MTSTTFRIPDLVKACPYPLRQNPHFDPVAAESTKWLDGYNIHPNEAHRQAYESCAFSLLVSYVYPRADRERFRILCDFIGALFAFDDLMDEEHLVRDTDGTKAVMDVAMNALWHPDTYSTDFRIGQAVQSFWARAIKLGCAPGAQRRFLEYTDHYCRAVHEQVANRSRGHIMDIESFTRMRRDTGALKICFVMGEFGLGLDLPDEVFENPLIQAMENASNDAVVISNDIYSWNIEQAQGHTANIITVIMNQQAISVQQAMDIAGNEMYKRFQTFVSSKAKLPSWGPQVDAQVQAYSTVLEDWMIGSFCWSLESERYFGKSAAQIRKTLEVRILPREFKTATDLRTAKANQHGQDMLVWGSLSLTFMLFTGIALIHWSQNSASLRSPVHWL